MNLIAVAELILQEHYELARGSLSVLLRRIVGVHVLFVFYDISNVGRFYIFAIA